MYHSLQISNNVPFRKKPTPVENFHQGFRQVLGTKLSLSPVPFSNSRWIGRIGVRLA